MGSKWLKQKFSIEGMESGYRGKRIYACSGRKVENFKQDGDKLEVKLKYVLVEAKSQY